MPPLGFLQTVAYKRIKDMLAADSVPLLVLHAPAGYGKRTIARELLRSLPAKWRFFDTYEDQGGNIVEVVEREHVSGAHAIVATRDDRLFTSLSGAAHIFEKDLRWDDALTEKVLREAGTRPCDIARALAFSRGWPALVLQLAQLARLRMLTDALDHPADFHLRIFREWAYDAMLARLDLRELEAFVRQALSRATDDILLEALREHAPHLLRAAAGRIVEAPDEPVVGFSRVRTLLRCGDSIAALQAAVSRPLGELFDNADILADFNESAILHSPALWLATREIRLTGRRTQSMAELESLPACGGHLAELLKAESNWMQFETATMQETLQNAQAGWDIAKALTIPGQRLEVMWHARLLAAHARATAERATAARLYAEGLALLAGRRLTDSALDMAARAIDIAHECGDELLETVARHFFDEWPTQPDEPSLWQHARRTVQSIHTPQQTRMDQTVLVELLRGTVRERGRLVRLTPSETELLFVLAAAQSGIPVPVPASSGALRVRMNRLRARFDTSVLTNTGSGYSLSATVQIDAFELSRLARASSNGGVQDFAPLHKIRPALQHIAKNPLRIYEWFVPIERVLRQHGTALLRLLAIAASSQKDAAELLLLAQEMYAIDPYDEDALLFAVRAHVLSGDLPAAMEEYQDFTHRMKRDLGIVTSAPYEDLLREAATAI